MARHVDDFSNTAHRVFKHVVGAGKGLVLGDVVAQHFLQFFIEHHNQRVHIGLQLGQTCVGVGHAASAFPIKRLGHHAHGQDAHVFGHAGNHGGGSGTSTAAHACGNKQHVRAIYGFANVFYCHFCGFAAFFGFAACAQSAAAQLHHFMGTAAA